MNNISFIEQQLLSNTWDDQSRFPILIMGICHVTMRHWAQDESLCKTLLEKVSCEVQLLG